VTIEKSKLEQKASKSSLLVSETTHFENRTNLSNSWKRGDRNEDDSKNCQPDRSNFNPVPGIRMFKRPTGLFRGTNQVNGLDKR
jgi:hypothetical protein